MIYKFQYYSDEERLRLLIENENLVLIEEQNISEGNFLVFTDKNSLTTVEEEILFETKYQTMLLEMGGMI